MEQVYSNILGIIIENMYKIKRYLYIGIPFSALTVDDIWFGTKVGLSVGFFVLVKCCSSLGVTVV